jgi:hypothetical protein
MHRRHLSPCHLMSWDTEHLQRLTLDTDRSVRLRIEIGRRIQMITHIRTIGPTSLTEGGPGEAHASPKITRKALVN